MVYELYVDSLFLVNFVMNLYLLLLTNRASMRTATRVRMLLGAGAGATVYVLCLLIELPAWLKWPLSVLIGTGLMLVIAFRPRSFRVFLRLFRRLCQYSFLMGGLLLFAEGAVPGSGRYITRIGGVLGGGAVIYLALSWMRERDRRRKSGAGHGRYRVRLANGEIHVDTTAFVDSGNGLSEPVSGKPVSVIGNDVFRALWPEEPELFRIIPYRSIGRKNGILRGYLLPQMEVETEEDKQIFCDVYVAVSEECPEDMILNPRILEKIE